MPIDYVSTVPWNDPTNPFPKYTQVALSGRVVDSGSNVLNINCILTMTGFEPGNVNGNKVSYQNAAVGNGGTALFYYFDNSFKGWYLQIGNTNPRFVANTNEPTPYLVFDVPYIYTAGSVGPWVNASGTGINTLLITPVLSSVAGWELRRKRLLEIV